MIWIYTLDFNGLRLDADSKKPHIFMLKYIDFG